MANFALSETQERPNFDLGKYNRLQIRYLQAENDYNKYLLKFTNMVMDNVKDFNHPSQEEFNIAMEKARAGFNQMQEAIEAEKAYIEIKNELDAKQGKQMEELKLYFMHK